MWNPILNTNQLILGARLRYRIYGANDLVLVETEYTITERGQLIMLIEAFRTHEGEIPEDQRTYLPISLQNIARLQQRGIEIWEE